MNAPRQPSPSGKSAVSSAPRRNPGARVRPSGGSMGFQRGTPPRIAATLRRQPHRTGADRSPRGRNRSGGRTPRRRVPPPPGAVAASRRAARAVASSRGAALTPVADQTGATSPTRARPAGSSHAAGRTPGAAVGSSRVVGRTPSAVAASRRVARAVASSRGAALTPGADQTGATSPTRARGGFKPRGGPDTRGGGGFKPRGGADTSAVAASRRVARAWLKPRWPTRADQLARQPDTRAGGFSPAAGRTRRRWVQATRRADTGAAVGSSRVDHAWRPRRSRAVAKAGR